MKKIVMLLAAALISVSAFSQVRFGAKVGLNLSHFWGEDAPHGIKAGVQFGGLMEYRFNHQFALAPELVFSMQGSTSDNVSYNVNYINIPVMLKYYVMPNLSVDFGPQLGFKVYSKVGGNKPLADTNGVDFGLGLGATYDITPNIFVQARYNMGFVKVYDADALWSEKYAKAKNGNIQFAIGYMF